MRLTGVNRAKPLAFLLSHLAHEPSIALRLAEARSGARVCDPQRVRRFKKWKKLMIAAILSLGATISTSPLRGWPGRTLLRIRLLERWRATSAQIGAETLPTDSQGTVDISRFRDKFTVH